MGTLLLSPIHHLPTCGGYVRLQAEATCDAFQHPMLSARERGRTSYNRISRRTRIRLLWPDANKSNQSSVDSKSHSQSGAVAVNLNEIVDSISSFNLRTLALALREPKQVRNYLSNCLKRYDELAGKGLPSRSPVVPNSNETITLPAIHSGGGMSFAELVILARVTKTCSPRAIFEMGSYDGLTTAVFLLNAPPAARVYSLALPPKAAVDGDDLDCDKDLVAARHLGAISQAIGLNHYTQILCDTMEFDPAPLANSIELGLVDSEHDLKHVRNDTIKMATMMTDDGLVFWHDYGGKGTLRPLANYLEGLAQRCSLFRIPETSLAWACAKDLKHAVLEAWNRLRAA